MAEIKQTERAAHVMKSAFMYCNNYRHEFVMPEHLLLALVDDSNFIQHWQYYAVHPVLPTKLRTFLMVLRSYRMR